jgi:hypothetical protein
MSTYIDQAHTRVQAEHDALEAKLDAIDTFTSRVGELSVEQAPPSSKLTTAGTLSGTTATGETACRTVRTAFAETIQPHTTETDSVLTAIQTAFSESVAAALAPTTDASFSTELKKMVLSAARKRRTETEVMRQALEKERTHLATASESVDEITSWIADADERPLTDLDFEQLRARHETLTDHREQCDSLVSQRQQFLHDTTNKNTELGIRHETLIPSLYEDFPVDHPVLATVVRVEDICTTCQRAVRTHLVQRV